MTHSASNYGGYHIGKWKVGQHPKAEKIFVVVTYDQTNNAYVIDRDDHQDFLEWLSGELFEDYDLETEEPREFLEHNDVQIKVTDLEDGL